MFPPIKMQIWESHRMQDLNLSIPHQPVLHRVLNWREQPGFKKRLRKPGISDIDQTLGKSRNQKFNFSPKRNWNWTTQIYNYLLWQVRTTGIELFHQKNAIINCGTCILQKFNFSPKKIAIVASPDFRNWTFPLSPKKCNCPQVQNSGIELFPKKHAVVPKKMQLSPSPASGIELFRPKKMQLSIVARPYFRNLTFPTKKWNCGKSGLQKLNFPPQKMQLWHIQTTRIQLFAPKNAIMASLDSGIELFPPKNAIINCGTSILQFNFSPQRNAIGASPYFRNWTFSPKEMQSWQVRTSEIDFLILPKFTNWTFPPKKCNCGTSRLQEFNFLPQKTQLWQVLTWQFLKN